MADKVLAKCDELMEKLGKFDPKLDDREGYTPGWKFNEWEMKGVPVRLEIGPKDLEANQVVAVMRDTREKQFIKIDDLPSALPELLKQMQDRLLCNAKQHIRNSVVEVCDMDAFASAIKARKLVKTTFCGEDVCEEAIKDKTEGASSRCVPLDDPDAHEGSKCVHCGKDAKVNIYFSKSY